MKIQITHGHTSPSLFSGYFYYTTSTVLKPTSSPISNLSRISKDSLLLFSLDTSSSSSSGGGGGYEEGIEEEGIKMVVNVLKASRGEKKWLLRLLYSGAVINFRSEIDDSPYAISTALKVPLPLSTSTSSSSNSSNSNDDDDDDDEEEEEEEEDSQATIKFKDLQTKQEMNSQKKRKIFRVNSLHILPGVLISENGVKILDENHIIASRFRELIEERIWNFEKPK